MTASCGHLHRDGITPVRGSEEERCDAGVAAAYLIRRELGVPLEAPTGPEQRDALRPILDALNLRGPRTVDYLTGPPVNAHTETPR